MIHESVVVESSIRWQFDWNRIFERLSSCQKGFFADEFDTKLPLLTYITDL